MSPKANMNRTLTSIKDWPAPTIIAALWNKHLSLRRLSIANNYSPGTLANAIRKNWPRGESIIADAIGVEASVIWPSRYARRARREANRR